jgi:hypothetical protein
MFHRLPGAYHFRKAPRAIVIEIDLKFSRNSARIPDFSPFVCQKNHKSAAA